MTDSQDPKQPDPPADPTLEDQEKKYWDTFEARLDGWFDKRLEKVRQQGTSRTGSGRTTLPKLFADMIFGPPKE